MDLMDFINYMCWIGGAILGFWVARWCGATRGGPVLGAAVGAVGGGLFFIFMLMGLDWWDKRAPRRKRLRTLKPNQDHTKDNGDNYLVSPKTTTWTVTTIGDFTGKPNPWGVSLAKIDRKDTAANMWMDRYDDAGKKIAALSLEEARRQAELLLSDPRKFECVPSERLSNDTLSKFAPGLQSLFSRYATILVIDDEAYLTRDEIAQLNWHGNGLSWGEEFWRIGAANGYSITLVKPHDERVYDTMDDEVGDPYPSVYHWLLMVSAIASDFK